MLPNTIIGIAGFALACAQLEAGTLNDRNTKGEDKKDKIEFDQPEKPDLRRFTHQRHRDRLLPGRRFASLLRRVARRSALLHFPPESQAAH